MLHLLPQKVGKHFTLAHTHTHAYCEQLKHIKQLCEHILTRFYFAKFFPIALLASLTSPLTSLQAASSMQRGLTLAVTANDDDDGGSDGDCDADVAGPERRSLMF